MSILATELADEPLSLADERDYAVGLIRRIASECPKRKSTGPDERRAQEILQRELASQGLHTEFVPFRYNNSLYAVLALHFGLATFASAVYFFSPLSAFALHLFAAVSYLGDSTYSFSLLRGLLPKRNSQNLVATMPASGPTRLRIVLVGHADAAPTGWMFGPKLIKAATNHYHPRPFRFLRKQMVGAMLAMLILALLDLMQAAKVYFDTLPTGLSMPILFYGMTLACAIPLALNLQLVFRNRIVPGASDNLTGCAALPVLASRFAEKKPDDVELVFVATGCEEAGCGGSLALAQSMGQRWEKHKTVVIALDILTNGELRYKQCGEIIPLPVAPWLYDTLQEVAAADDRWGALQPFDAPAGSDDAAPFLAHGYEGTCLCCIDPELGVSRHYHLPSDTPDNIEADTLMDSIDFAENLVEGVIRRRKADSLALATGEPLAEVRGEPAQPYFPRILAGWQAWLFLGPMAGLYCGGMFAYSWEASFVVFRCVWTLFVITFPVFLWLAHIGRNPDRSRVAQVYVFFLLAAMGISFAGMFVYPLGHGVMQVWQVASPVARTVGMGAIVGGIGGIAAAIWMVSRAKARLCKSLARRLGM